MSIFENNLVLLLNTRSCLSLIGILIIVIFSWQWDKKWEEEGPENAVDTSKEEGTSKPASGNYEAMEGGTEDADAKATEEGEMSDFDWKETMTYPDATSSNSTVPPVIKPALIGWGLLALSYLFPRKAWIGIEYRFVDLFSVVLMAGIGYLNAVVVPKAIVQRKFSAKKDMISLLMVGGMLIEGVMTFLQDMDGPVFAAIIGSLCIAVAPMLLWRARLVGGTYEKEGRVNPKPVLYNFGGPLLMFGWFWFWVGMNTSYFFPGKWSPYIHVYVGLRMFFAFLGGISVILTTWFVGYALDEIENLSGQPETPEGLMQASAFGMEDYFCGYVYEIKVATILSWCALGLAMFFPYMWNDYSDWIFLAACAGMGYCMAQIQEQGMRMLQADQVETWSKRAYAMLAIIVIIIPIQQGGHYMAVILAVLGAVSFAVGMQYMFLDQKRGKKWLASQQVQKPNVFSVGVLLTPLGALVLAWAVSMHPQ